MFDHNDEYLSESFAAINLPGASLIAKVFEDCTFKSCDLNGADFNKSKFVDCHFKKCNLSIVKINQCKFSEVTFEECKITGVDWTRAWWPSLALSAPIKFLQCVISDSSFFGLSLSEIVIADCKAHDVDFREGDFSWADFAQTDFENSLFGKTNLTGANFTDALNYTIDIYLNQIKKAKFCRHEAIRLLDSLGIELVD